VPVRIEPRQAALRILAAGRRGRPNWGHSGGGGRGEATAALRGRHSGPALSHHQGRRQGGHRQLYLSAR
jgi:hypothetical protein